MRKPFFSHSAATITPALKNVIQGDLSAVLDKTRVDNEDPRVKRPAVMIRSVRYVGTTQGATVAEVLPVKSHALYEYLMSSAQLELQTQTKHRVSFADAQAYLDVPRADRIKEYIAAINRTLVTYEFEDEDGTLRRGDGIQLLACENNVLPTGERVIEYTMHPSVRKVMIEMRQYAHLEVAAFARFTSKYSARLYPKLALVAGSKQQYPLSYTPEQLAEELGYVPRKGKGYHWGHFEADCLKPAMAEMFGRGSADGKEFQAPAVRRFSAEYEVRRATTRGRPVTAVVFHVTKAEKHVQEQQTSDIVLLDRNRVRKIFADARLDHIEAPTDELLAKAADRLKTPLTNIAQRWADMMALAKDDPEALVGSRGYYTGQQILDMIAADGVGKTFVDWLSDWEAPDAIRYRGAAVTVEKPRVSFDAADTIRIDMADDVSNANVREMIEWAEDLNLFRGPTEKRVRIERGGDVVIEFDTPITPSALRDIHTNHRDKIHALEFLK